LSRREIEGCYARLKGLNESSVYVVDTSLPKSFGVDYARILSKLRESVDDLFEHFDLTRDDEWSSDDPNYYYNKVTLRSKYAQLINYLESVHRVNDKIVQIGSAYNLIRDSELKSRCGDLLSASNHFDRVINQATQVLEERLRVKLPEYVSDYGANLVGKAINPEPSKSRIVFSQTASEQEGYASLFRGLISAFRNPTHHRFMETVTREQALQICAFIDNMLLALDLAEIPK
jgi:Protein of unknown function (Hypoth_ymh)